MQKVKFLILGAGPSGLAFARSLKDMGEDSFLVLEKEDEAGGLCRSVTVAGGPFDIGGGHFLDVKRKMVNDLLFRFLPENEWDLYERDSRIEIKGDVIGHPFEANIWQLPLEKQVDYLESIAKAGCNSGQPQPYKFVDWISWKLGDRIAEDYMIPYNKKMFADELNELGTYWLEKLPNVSFKETLLSCLTHKPYGTQPGHAKFYYPKKYGYGEVWLRMADSMKEHMRYNRTVKQLDVTGKRVVTADGSVFEAENIVTTIPWNTIEEIIHLPKEQLDGIHRLKHSSIETRYVDENLDTKAQWIYYPEEELPYHRILVRHNFCPNSKGYWLETRKERTAFYHCGEEMPATMKEDRAASDKKESRAFSNETVAHSFAYMNDYAYPLNTVDKPAIMDGLLAFCRENRVFGLGRWGEHNHYNSDVTVEKAMMLAKEIF